MFVHAVEPRIVRPSFRDIAMCGGVSGGLLTGKYSGPTSTPAATPADFGTLLAWIDPRYDITHSGDATAVTDWNDHSAAALNGVVVSAPTYHATGWNGSLPSVSFNGTSDALALDGLAASISGSDKPIYVVAAIQMGSVASGQSIFSGGQAATPPHNRYRELGTITSSRYYPASRDDSLTIDADVSSVGALTTTRAHVTWAFSGTDVTLYFNGTVDSVCNLTPQNVGTITMNQFTIGARRGTSASAFATIAHLGPVFFYSSLTDRAGAEGLLTGWGYTHA